VRAMINVGHRLVQEHEGMTTPHTHIDAYTGYKGEETPRAFALDGVRLSVEEIIDLQGSYFGWIKTIDSLRRKSLTRWCSTQFTG